MFLSGKSGLASKRLCMLESVKFCSSCEEMGGASKVESTVKDEPMLSKSYHCKTDYA